MGNPRKPDIHDNNKSVPGQAPGKTALEILGKANEVVSHSLAAALVSPEERHFRISLAAYRRAETRQFQSGGELEDWLLAEREVDAELNEST